MQTKWLTVVALSLCGASAQILPGGSTNADVNPPGAYTVVERGKNNRIFERRVRETNELGQVTVMVQRYNELQSGLHRSVAGSWVETSENIDILPGGGAGATNLCYQAYLPGNPFDDAFELTTPEGHTLTSRPLGLAYADEQRSVVIATLKPGATGQILPAGNQVLYSDICTGYTGCHIDLLVTTRKSGYESDVVFRTQLPDPTEYGFSNAVRLQWITEFVNSPEPAVTPGIGLVSDIISFGEMGMDLGRMYVLGSNAPAALKAPVVTRWIASGARRFLVEEVLLETVIDQLLALPPRQASLNPGSRKGADLQEKVIGRGRDAEDLIPTGPGEGRVRNDGTSPPQRGFGAPSRSITGIPIKRPIRRDGTRLLQASAGYHESPGLVLDYNLLSGTLSSFTFTNGTFLIGGAVTLTGTTTIEAGAVIKFTNSPSATLKVSGPLVCRTRPYGEAVLTSANDDSVGDQISWSTHYPTNTNGAVYVTSNIQDFPPAYTNVFRYLRFAYAGTALYLWDSASKNDVWHCQFVRCGTAINWCDDCSGSFYGLHNVLAYECGSMWIMGSLVGEHVTMIGGALSGFGPGYDGGYLTNSILLGVTNYVTNYFGNCYTGSTSAGILQTVAAGVGYLATNTLRNVGTTNISPALVDDLRTKTSWPPIVFTNITFTNDLVLSAQVERDANVPDLGYHYDSLDYLFNLSRIYNSTTTVFPGTAIALGGTYGLALRNGGKLICEGTPDNLIRFVRYNTVQEQANTNWSTMGSSVLINGWPDGLSTIASFRFTEWSALAQDGYQFQQWNPSTATLRDSQIHGSKVDVKAGNLYVTNCLVERVDTTIDDDSADVTTTIRNALFFGGALKLNHVNSDAAHWVFRDSLFDRVAVTQSGDVKDVSEAYNGYVNTTQLTPTNAYDVILTSFSYATGPLGSYYQLSTNLLDHGSTNASLLGLYHYTVSTNLISGLQIKETNSIVDIGFHYVALNGSLKPMDSDGDGWPDYWEDSSGDGLVESGETDWLNSADLGLSVRITRPSPGPLP